MTYSEGNVLKLGDFDLRNTDRQFMPYMIGTDGTIKITFEGHDLFFHAAYMRDGKEDWSTISGLTEVFHDNIYDWLPVLGRIVVDIGSNVGDTPIYFLSKGASKVICIEANSDRYSVSLINIALNGMHDKAVMINKCCGKSGDMPEAPAFITLDEIVEKYAVPYGSSLKLDCEGCEYDALLDASSEAIMHFSDIILEYHAGHARIVDRLSSIGYEVSYAPASMKPFGNPNGGYIYAKLKLLSKISSKPEAVNIYA